MDQIQVDMICRKLVFVGQQIEMASMGLEADLVNKNLKEIASSLQGIEGCLKDVVMLMQKQYEKGV